MEDSWYLDSAGMTRCPIHGLHILYVTFLISAAQKRRFSVNPSADMQLTSELSKKVIPKTANNQARIMP